MNYRVTLGHEHPDVDDEEVIVDTVMLDSDLIMLGMFDPSFCPPAYHDEIQFNSKGLTASIWPDSDAHVVEVQPTDEEVPEPEVFY